MKDKEQNVFDTLSSGVNTKYEDGKYSCNCIDKEKQIEEMAQYVKGYLYPLDNNSIENCRILASALISQGWIKPSKDSVVLSREEYDELINLRQTHAEDLINAIQSYEESKADLKLEYDNHIKSLEKTIDRQSKDLNSQADRLIDLKAELENKGKETAEKFTKGLIKIIKEKDTYLDWDDVLEFATEQFGVEIKE